MDWWRARLEKKKEGEQGTSGDFDGEGGGYDIVRLLGGGEESWEGLEVEDVSGIRDLPMILVSKSAGAEPDMRQDRDVAEVGRPVGPVSVCTLVGSGDGLRFFEGNVAEGDLGRLSGVLTVTHIMGL